MSSFNSAKELLLNFQYKTYSLSLFCFVLMFPIDVFSEMFVPSFPSLFFSIYWTSPPLVNPVPH